MMERSLRLRYVELERSTPIRASLDAVVRAFELAGVEFIDGDRPGVRLSAVAPAMRQAVSCRAAEAGPKRERSRKKNGLGLAGDAAARRPRATAGSALDTLAAGSPLTLAEESRLTLQAQAQANLAGEAAKAREKFIAWQADETVRRKVSRGASPKRRRRANSVRACCCLTSCCPSDWGL
jgi:hypothetical protein